MNTNFVARNVVRPALLMLTMAFAPTTLTAAPQPARSGKKDPRKEQALKVGDAAPALEGMKWLAGSEVKQFASGRIYVAAFWAPWCSPSVVMLPRLNELQREYRDKGVSIIAISARDSNNTLEKVSDFVEQRGPKLGLSAAFDDNGDVYQKWMTPTDARTLPYSFVVGPDGKIAYAGHPMFLPLVLPQVAAGKFTSNELQATLKLAAETEAALSAAGGLNSEAGLHALDAFRKAHPELAALPYFVEPRIRLLVKLKQWPEARKAADQGIVAATKYDDAITLEKISGLLRSAAAAGDKELLQLSLKAAVAAQNAAGEKDMLALLNLAESYFAVGDADKAREFGAKALAATVGESEAMKKYVKQQVQRFTELKK